MKPALPLIVILLLLNLVPSIGRADCPIPSNANVEEAISTYSNCLEAGEPVAVNIDSAIGIKTFSRKNYQQAIAHFSGLIATEESVQNYLQRGLAYLASGNERRAIADFEMVNTMSPGSSVGHFYRGAAKLARRRYGDAVDAFTTAINLSAGGTSLAPMYFAMAQAELARRNRELALTNLNNAIDSDPTYSPALFERALLHRKLDNVQGAIEDYTSYIELRPDAAEAYYNRGLIYQDLRQDHLAIRDFNRAIELEPGSVKMRASRGFTYLWPLLPVLIVLALG